MPVILRSMNDPLKSEKIRVEVPKRFKLRNIETQEKVLNSDGNAVINKVKTNEDCLKAAKNETVRGFTKLVDCQDMFDLYQEGVQEKIPRKIYYLGRHNKKLFCGPVLQVIPNGTFCEITAGQSTYCSKLPLTGNQFKFEKDRQLIFKAGKRETKDYVLVLGRNGCIVIEANSYGLLNMPLFVVHRNGQYYHINHKNRSLELGKGVHVIVYTKEAPIIFATIDKTEQIKELVFANTSDPELNAKTEQKKENDVKDSEAVKAKEEKCSKSDGEDLGDVKHENENTGKPAETEEKTSKENLSIGEEKGKNTDKSETEKCGQNSDEKDVKQDSEKK